MLKNVIMPQGSQDLVPGRVVRWTVAEGSPVIKGQVICEVETEKAVFEINSPVDGYLRKIVTPEGEEADVFATIGYVGDLDVPLPGEEKQPVVVAASVYVPSSEPVPAGNVPARTRLGKVRITPLAKKITKELKIDYTSLVGTGPNGRIVAADVLAAKKAVQAAPAAVPPAPASATAPTPPLTPAAPVTQPAKLPVSSPQVDTSAPGKTESLSRIRKVMAQRMQLSMQVAPHFYVTVSLDMTDALQYREVFNKRPGLAKEDMLSINDMIVRACALALKEFPQINSSVVDEETIMLWEDIHIGIATALGSGELVVPVLEHADWLSLSQLPSKTRRLFNLAKEGKQASLVPSHFTISNLGMFNVESFTAIINPPETAILAVASIEKRVMPPKGEHLGVRLRDMLNLTLSLDHRVGDGVLAARFTNRVRELLETPQYLE
jgi:pyruvate dehydrogenase E2 component (dihydrolipoamide acetyltransferase)